MRLNELVVGDTAYTMTKAYRDGAMAMRMSIPVTYNPHCNTDSQAHYDWEDGHTNEAACEHIRFGVDVLHASLTGVRFEEDSNVPRDDCAEVDSEWYHKQLTQLTAQ
jgi:hypothetical protein